MTGDPFIAGFNNPPFDLNAKRWGWQGAIGVDYKFASSPWHLSADFRYMTNGTNNGASTETAIFSPAVVVVGSNAATRKEHNWEADFMVGHDLGIGNAQLKVGVRVADIWGQTTGAASWTMPPPTPPTQTINYQQTDRWLGVGPRAAIEGTVPLGGAWSLDYNGGIAGLWGKTTGDQTISVTTAGVGPVPVCVSGCPIAITTKNNAGVFNADGQLGLAYAFSQNAKLSLNYRIDYYDHVLATYNAGGNGIRVSRTYHGPTLKLTVSY